MAQTKKSTSGVIRRRIKREIGIFIDGTGLDRAARRINKRIDMNALVQGVSSGLSPTFARYYTLLPFEDDARHHSFLDAVARAGLSVVVKRLPPKGITRQVTVDVEMAADIVAFARGHSQFSDLSTYSAAESFSKERDSNPPLPSIASPQDESAPETGPEEIKRIVTVVCPSRELAYPIALVKELGVDTVSADFATFNAGDILKSAAKWIDLSDSETIWRP